MRSKQVRRSEKTKERGICCHYPGERAPRFIEAFLLLILSEGPIHGYMILTKLREMGLEYEANDIGYIYRNLRRMEKNGFVVSEWDLGRRGPSRRVYSITEEGEQRLDEWIKSLKIMRKNLGLFLRRCNELKKNRN